MEAQILDAGSAVQSIYPVPPRSLEREEIAPGRRRDVQPAGRTIGLPAHLPSIVDRKEDLTAISSLLLSGEVRLLTLTGPGGVGKTRLAVEAGQHLASCFTDGVVFVDLSPIRDPDRVIDALARSLAVEPGPGTGSTLQRLEAALKDRAMLLILDNPEQVLPAAPALAELLAAAPDVTLLVTSREPLHLRWEQLYHVEPLAVPDLGHLPSVEELAQVPSVELFLRRASMLNPDFRLTEGNALAVAELVVHLDGLPLAIKLAASRTPFLSPQMLLERLNQRLSLFRWEAQDLPARQHTLGAAIAWSYDHLAPKEQVLFSSLGVFAGRFSLEAVEAIAAGTISENTDVLEGLSSLVDKSLVQREDTGVGEYRFRLLESVREYALERLDEAEATDAVRRLHAYYCVALAERAEPELTGPQQREWFLRIEETRDNLTTAVEWLLDHDEGEAALRLAVALAHFWEVRGYLAEGRRWLEGALAAAPAAAPAIRARALTWLGAILALGLDEGSPAGSGDARCAEDLLNQGMDLARGTGDAVTVARALTFRGVLRLQTGEWDEGKRLLHDARTGWQQAGHDWGIVQALVPLGVMAILQGNDGEAQYCTDEILSRYRNVGDDWGRGVALLLSMSPAATRGDLPRAAAVGQEMLTLSVESQCRRLLYLAAAGTAWLARTEDDLTRQAQLVGAAGSMDEAAGLVNSVVGRLYLAPTREVLECRMRPEDLDAALKTGRSLAFPQVAALIGAVLENVGRQASPSATGPERQRTGLFSGREYEVLQLVAEGLSNKQIAKALFIAETTVRYHLTSVFNKLGVDTRAHAISVAMQRGLLELG